MTPRVRRLRRRMYAVWTMTAACVAGWMWAMTPTAARLATSQSAGALAAEIRGAFEVLFGCLAVVGSIASLWVIGDYNSERVAPTDPKGFDVIQ